MDITAVLILITTDEEMKEKNAGIAVKDYNSSMTLAAELADCLSFS